MISLDSWVVGLFPAVRGIGTWHTLWKGSDNELEGKLCSTRYRIEVIKHVIDGKENIYITTN
jgi:hypothetical protein